jgi:lysyl-tRNA synthetase class I
MNSDSMQERNQSIHTYFEDKKTKRKKQPINFKFVIIITQITRQRLSEALYQDVFKGHICLKSARNCSYSYLEIINYESCVCIKW